MATQNPGGNRAEVMKRLYPGVKMVDGKPKIEKSADSIRKLVARFAWVAYRRPVKTDTLKPYQELALAEYRKSNDFNKALHAGYRAVLCSPRFLTLVEKPGKLDDPRGFLDWVAHVGQGTFGAWKDTLSILEFLGLTLHRLFRTLIMPWRLRKAALVTHMEETGVKALPIVALMGFLIGVVLAFQGATQLKQFGAEIFVVELISISILRELGILLTAIIVAGRSGSAFTASIGSMKVQEEIDAMRTLGLDPIEVLVIPRVLALLIMLPILGFVADMAGLFGGALMSWIDLGVSPGMFVTRLKENTDVWQLAVGLIKAPFFALVIGVIACWQALQVKGSAQSVGQRTTASVVQSIFMVIAIDALFSIFFSEIGI